MIKKHVGKIKSSDQRCVVVFMSLPDEPDQALIVNIEALHPRFEQMVLDVVDSTEGQAERDLASALARRTVPETNRSILEELHARGLMRKESVDNIIMLPRPNMPLMLRDILKEMGQEPPKSATTVEDKFNPIAENLKADAANDRMGLAKAMLIEAEMLEAEARAKREKAYQYVPSLRPQPQVGTTQPAQPEVDSSASQTNPEDSTGAA